MPSPLRNGDATPRLPSPVVAAVGHHHHFRSTVSEQKIRRLNALVLLLRVAAFCFSLAAAIFTATNSARSQASPSWLHFDTFRFAFAANAIVAAYSLFEIGVSIWEMLKGDTLLPEPMQLWFDFAHDQVFAYLVATAGSAGAVEAQGLRRGPACDAESAFCLQADIAVALGFAGFGFLALSALFSSFRLASFLITGSRFPLQ